MVNITKTDRRIVRTKKAIIGSFLQLLDQKSFSEVTVTEIAHIADISKATFYLHYKNKDQILDQTIRDVFDELQVWIDENKPVPLHFLFVNIFQILYNNKKLMEILLQSGVDLKIMEISRNFTYDTLRKSIIDDFPSTTLPFLNDFVSGGYYLVIYQWLKNGFRETPEEMATICEKFFVNLDL